MVLLVVLVAFQHGQVHPQRVIEQSNINVSIIQKWGGTVPEKSFPEKSNPIAEFQVDGIWPPNELLTALKIVRKPH